MCGIPITARASQMNDVTSTLQGAPLCDPLFTVTFIMRNEFSMDNAATTPQHMAQDQRCVGHVEPSGFDAEQLETAIHMRGNLSAWMQHVDIEQLPTDGILSVANAAV